MLCFQTFTAHDLAYRLGDDTVRAQYGLTLNIVNRKQVQSLLRIRCKRTTYLIVRPLPSVMLQVHHVTRIFSPRAIAVSQMCTLKTHESDSTM